MELKSILKVIFVSTEDRHIICGVCKNGISLMKSDTILNVTLCMTHDGWDKLATKDQSVSHSLDP